MQIDCYGIDATDVHYKKLKLQPYMVSASGNIVYICFDSGTPRAIQRITQTADGIIIDWAYGAWEQRAGLEYIPINRTRCI